MAKSASKPKATSNVIRFPGGLKEKPAFRTGLAFVTGGDTGCAVDDTAVLEANARLLAAFYRAVNLMDVPDQKKFYLNIVGVLVRFQDRYPEILTHNKVIADIATRHAPLSKPPVMGGLHD